MAVRVEWRTRGEMNDTLLVVDAGDNTVRQAVPAAPTVLQDFLNDMVGLDTWRQGPAVAEDKPSPAVWGSWSWPGPRRERCSPWIPSCFGRASISGFGRGASTPTHGVAEVQEQRQTHLMSRDRATALQRDYRSHRSRRAPVG